MTFASRGQPVRFAIIGAASSLGVRLLARLPGAAVPVLRKPSGRPGEIVVNDYAEISPDMIHGCTHLINCVGAVNGPLETLRAINAELPSKLLSTARTAGVGHFVHVSSFSVFGNAPRIGCTSQFAPINDYGRTKLAGEMALRAEKGVGNTALAILRIPAIFGGGNSDKLRALCTRWLAVGDWLMPQGDIRRSMISMSSTCDVIGALSLNGRAGTFMAADPVPFSYRLAHDALRRGGFPGLRLHELPTWLSKSIAVAVPRLARSLFQDSFLLQEDNSAIEFSIKSDIENEILRISQEFV